MFYQEDIAANREGNVSDDQITRLESLYHKEIWNMLGIMAVCSFIALIITQKSMEVLGIALVVCIGGTFVWRLPLLLKLSADMTTPEAVASTAPIKLDVNVNHGKTTTVDYALMVNQMTLVIDKETLLALRDGEPYTVYYTRHAKTFLSAEPAAYGKEKRKHQS